MWAKILQRRAFLCFSMWLFASAAIADKRSFVLVQSTTSTQNSGLFDHILPIFSEETGLDVRVVAVGTGQALRNAANGDGDVVVVHARNAEEAFVAEGHGTERHDLMYNDFVLVGPGTDPAGVSGVSIEEALERIQESGAVFVSRGDDSGTHKAELQLWADAGLNPARASGRWYRETGSGMGGTLNVAVGMQAYTLTDRATWVSFGNKSEHEILIEGDPALFNQYGVIAVNPDRHPGVNAEGAEQFVAWLLSEAGQAAIASFEVNGVRLFTPNASR